MNYSSPIFRRAFHSSPTALKTLAATAYGAAQRRRRYGKVFHEALADLRASQFTSNSELEAIRDRRAIEFVRRIGELVPAYRDGGYADVRSVADLAGLPVLTKSDLRAGLERFYNHSAIPRSTWAHTSGTTGKSIVFPLSRDCFQREYAFRALHYEWGGIGLHTRQKVAFCAGHPVADSGGDRPPFWVRDLANRWLFMSSYHLSATNLPAYVAELERFDPEMIGGYPSSIHVLAIANQRYGRGKLRPKAVYCSSETLFPGQRADIESSFATKVFNWYGNSEMCANITECEHGELHLKLEHSYVEVLDAANRPCGPGETGRLVCTGFGNDAFPLIRYDTGDFVTLAATQESRCGRGGVLVESIEGRMEDYIVTPEGRAVGRLDHLFKDSQGILEAQLVQDSPDAVVVRYVPGPGYSERDRDLVLAEGRARLGSAIRIEFQEVQEIGRTKNGKFRFIVSSIPQGEILRSLRGGS